MSLARRAAGLGTFPRGNMVFGTSSMPTCDPKKNNIFSEVYCLAYLKVVVAKKEPFFQKWRIRFRDYDSVHQRSLLFVRQGA